MRPSSVRSYRKNIKSSFQLTAEYAEHEAKCTLRWDTPTTSGENCCTNCRRNFACHQPKFSYKTMKQAAVYDDITSKQPELNLEISTCYNNKGTKGYEYT